MLLAVIAAGCAEATSTAPSSSESQSHYKPVAVRDASPEVLTDKEQREANALKVLTLAIARSLSDVGLRQRLLSDMQRSGVTDELKLQLSGYLSGASGGILLAKMAEYSGIPRDSLKVLVASVRPQELYLPVRSQRRQWKGEDLLVASQLREHAPILAYQTDGVPVALTEQTSPSRATLAIVGAETDFGQPAYSVTRSALQPQAMLDRQAAASAGISASVNPCSTPGCDETGGGGGGPPPPPAIPVTAPTGLYMTYSAMNDLKEPWIRGDPEVEMHIVGAYYYDLLDHARPRTCASAGSTGYKYFDQNANTWNGAVLLLSDPEFNSDAYVIGSPQGRRFNVVMYEDDDQRCIIQDDPNRFIDQASLLALAGATGHYVGRACGDDGTRDPRNPPASSLSCTLGVFGTIYLWGAALWHLFDSNDDYIGMAVRKDQVPGYSNGLATHAMLERGLDAAPVGGIALRYHVYGY